MNASDMKDIVSAMPSGRRAELFGVLIDLAEEADPTDNGDDSVTEALARRTEVESGGVEMLSEAEFWQGLRRF